MTIDLDKARAARREVKGEGPVILLEGVEYKLSPELPFETLEAMSGLADPNTAPSAMVTLTSALLGDHYEEIKSKLSMDDLNELVEGVMAEYEVDVPLDLSKS